MVKIHPAQDGESLENLITLAGEYVAWMLSEIEKHYPELDIEEFKREHGYDNVRSKFPGEHIPPHGCLLIATHNEQLAGCIALGKLSDDIGEVRTLFVRPSMRGAGVGNALVTEVLKKAKAYPYKILRLDTLRFMDGAFRLYQKSGFYEIEPYLELSESLKKYIRFMELKLD